ncbi:MAG: cytidylyltransferase domain-containing protein [Sphingobacteriaceae bacterium]
MDLLITICARGGSKGIPGKNIRLLNDRPLLDYTIKLANEFASRNDGMVSISTDSMEIRDVAIRLGLTTDYLRPDFLATDNAGKVDAIKDLLSYEEIRLNKKFLFVLDMDVTSPLRTYHDLELAYELIKSDKNALTLFSVNIASRNPYFNMVEKQQTGYFNLSKKLDSVHLTRQSAPKVYDLNASFYFYNRRFFDLNYNGVITDKSLIYEMDHTCFDLDHPIDFEFMEYLLVNKKLDFL